MDRGIEIHRRGACRRVPGREQVTRLADRERAVASAHQLHCRRRGGGAALERAAARKVRRP